MFWLGLPHHFLKKKCFEAKNYKLIKRSFGNFRQSNTKTNKKKTNKNLTLCTLVCNNIPYFPAFTKM